jgi:hypothetical protein
MTDRDGASEPGTTTVPSPTTCAGHTPGPSLHRLSNFVIDFDVERATSRTYNSLAGTTTRCGEPKTVGESRFVTTSYTTPNYRPPGSPAQLTDRLKAVALVHWPKTEPGRGGMRREYQSSLRSERV